MKVLSAFASFLYLWYNGYKKLNGIVVMRYRYTKLEANLGDALKGRGNLDEIFSNQVFNNQEKIKEFLDISNNGWKNLVKQAIECDNDKRRKKFFQYALQIHSYDDTGKKFCQFIQSLFFTKQQIEKILSNFFASDFIRNQSDASKAKALIVPANNWLKIVNAFAECRESSDLVVKILKLVEEKGSFRLSNPNPLIKFLKAYAPYPNYSVTQAVIKVASVSKQQLKKKCEITAWEQELFNVLTVLATNNNLESVTLFFNFILVQTPNILSQDIIKDKEYHALLVALSSNTHYNVKEFYLEKLKNCKHRFIPKETQDEKLPWVNEVLKNLTGREDNIEIGFDRYSFQLFIKYFQECGILEKFDKSKWTDLIDNKLKDHDNRLNAIICIASVGVSSKEFAEVIGARRLVAAYNEVAKSTRDNKVCEQNVLLNLAIKHNLPGLWRFDKHFTFGLQLETAALLSSCTAALLCYAMYAGVAANPVLAITALSVILSLYGAYEIGISDTVKINVFGKTTEQVQLASAGR